MIQKGESTSVSSPVKRKIAIVTSSRADYAHVRWLIHDLSREAAIDLQVIALGPHLSPAFGNTGKGIDAENISTVECLLDSDTDVGMAKTIGVATLGLADILGRLRPDILLIIADRYEMLAPAAVAMALRICIAHVEGGETTLGAIDDAVRNALTKMSHLHFACTRKAAERIAAMGEERWRITFSGSLSLDFLHRERLISQAAVERELKFKIAMDAILCIYHPVTLLKDTTEEAEEILAALNSRREQIIFVYPNADAGSRELMRRVAAFANQHRGARVLVNLDHRTYLSLLKYAGVLVGNSSSGIIECTSLEVPVVNVGIRQQGREYGANVINVSAEREAICAAIDRAVSAKFRRSIQRLESPYGDGRASKIICDVLRTVRLGPKLLFKQPQFL